MVRLAIRSEKISWKERIMEEMRPDSMKMPSSLLERLQKMATVPIGHDKQDYYAAAILAFLVADNDTQARELADYAQARSRAASRGTTVLEEGFILERERIATLDLAERLREKAKDASGASPAGSPARRGRKAE